MDCESHSCGCTLVFCAEIYLLYIFVTCNLFAIEIVYVLIWIVLKLLVHAKLQFALPLLFLSHTSSLNITSKISNPVVDSRDYGGAKNEGVITQPHPSHTRAHTHL